MGIDDIGYPSSMSNVRIQISWRLQSESAMYSASVLDRVMDFCAWELYENIPPANLKKYPVCDRRVEGSDAQSESVHAIIP